MLNCLIRHTLSFKTTTITSITIGAIVVILQSCDYKTQSQSLNIPQTKTLVNNSLENSTDNNKHFFLKDTINSNNPSLSIKNGVYYLDDELLSGILKTYYPRVDMFTFTSFSQGRRQGEYKSFYGNGQVYEIKHYQNAKVSGRHLMYWENGNPKAHYYYIKGQMNGVQKRWYKNGQPFSTLNYKNGKREGEQKAWRENGKLHINNQIINGRTYGLNRASLCYSLKDGQIETKKGYLKITDFKKTK